MIRLLPEFEELVKVAKDWDYESFHSHEEIIEIIGLALGTKYYRHVQLANRALKREHLRHLKVVPGKGYRVIHPNESGRVMAHEARLVANRFGKTLEIGIYANRQLLTQEEAQRLDEQLAKAGTAHLMLQESVRDQALIAAGKFKSDVPKMLKG